MLRHSLNNGTLRLPDDDDDDDTGVARIFVWGGGTEAVAGS